MQHSPTPNYQAMQGFTLIELLVAMLIFAMLALSGWQIMDSLSKTQQRTKIQVDQLSQLQYAYLQLFQDFSQVTSYVAIPSNQNLANQAQTITPTFSLNAQEVSFIRFANPDPRFNVSQALTKIRYVSQNNALVKQRSYDLHQNTANNHASQSVLLTEVKDIKWTAWSATDTPEIVNQFPDNQSIEFAQNRTNLYKNHQSNAQNQNNSQSNTAQKANDNLQDLTAYQQLPAGVVLSFTYHDEPIVWQFALTPKPPSHVKPINQNPKPKQ
ncbi:general secretion pathway protein J [Moraxella macacae 0408225]|uniref:Type II secretion system protein J n=1 Tax=Moraxella macacae 0408225 TaxID=1230338 RepID=L2F6F6_9GAMM|nr:type II secretion system minor pseudopilin GspJ [Moraxella macacae]ELA08639.1 general secretion pathway protein J [Moraxella macacae 0408225]